MNLSINDFEGPLDLLLHLVKSAKMDIYEIDTKFIIDKYLEFINTVNKENLDEMSEYLVMASELIHLKSRLLINMKIENEDEYEINSEEDLKNKLIEYEKYKNIVYTLKEYESNRNLIYTRESSNLVEYQTKVKLSPYITTDDLYTAFINLKKREEFNKPVNTKITRRELSVEDKITYINNYLSKNEKIEFSRLFIRDSNDEVVVTFLAVLTMVKNQAIKVSQKTTLDKIYIERII